MSGLQASIVGGSDSGSVNAMAREEGRGSTSGTTGYPRFVVRVLLIEALLWVPFAHGVGAAGMAPPPPSVLLYLSSPLSLVLLWVGTPLLACSLAKSKGRKAVNVLRA